MFKTCIILFSITFCFINGQVILPIDNETKKVTYYEVINTDTVLTKSLLIMNAEKWTEKNMNLIEIKADSGKVIGSGTMTMTDMKGILEKNTGKFKYDFILEVKNGKYRYMFTNFVYETTMTDKNGRNQKIITKNIEDQKAPGWTKLWNKHKANVNMRINSLINDLKEKMKVNPILAPVEQKLQKKSNDW